MPGGGSHTQAALPFRVEGEGEGGVRGEARDKSGEGKERAIRPQRHEKKPVDHKQLVPHMFLSLRVCVWLGGEGDTKDNHAKVVVQVNCNGFTSVKETEKTR